MGTFHQDTHALHGLTVVLETTDGRAYIGRFHEQDAHGVLLHGADVHEEGAGGLTNAAWIAQARASGFWNCLPQVRVALAEVASVRRLSS